MKPKPKLVAHADVQEASLNLLHLSKDNCDILFHDMAKLGLKMAKLEKWLSWGSRRVESLCNFRIS